MEDILKEQGKQKKKLSNQTCICRYKGIILGVDDSEVSSDRSDLGGAGFTRLSPEKEQALQTLDQVIQAAEESMSELSNFFTRFSMESISVSVSTTT